MALLTTIVSDVPSYPSNFSRIQTLHLNGWEQDLSGYVASALVLATFAMQSMRPLRITAIASNIAFIIYATTANLHPILILHGLLLPLNVFRLLQMTRSESRLTNEKMIPKT